VWVLDAVFLIRLYFFFPLDDWKRRRGVLTKEKGGIVGYIR
jgi:hypothetical protein